MNCPACGNALENQVQFCPKCYAPIEAPGFWRRLLSLFLATSKPRRPIVRIKRTVTINTTDKDGKHHQYHSLDEVPPELAKEIRNLESEAFQQATSVSTSDGPKIELTKKASISVFKVKDASGNERVYHSLEELPPEIRAAIEAARNNEGKG